MATWNGVITNAGNSLLNEWVNEKALSFDSAAAGQGTVAVAAMMAQTALVNQKQVASLLGGEKVSAGIRLKLRIAAPDTAYTLNQFCVSASVDGGASAMLALFQLEQGIPIPSKTESPDFTYTFYALISCSNTGTWTVTVDPSACVTQGDMTTAIAEAVKTKQDKITVKGLLLGDGSGNISAAVAGKDYGYPLATGSGAPTAATAGTPGQHYYDSSTGKEHVCSGKDSSGSYQWKLSGASDASDLTYNGQALDDFLDGVSGDLDDLADGLDGSKPLTGKIDPTSSTKGAVGQSYLNTDTMQTFCCTAANDQTGVYTWEEPADAAAVGAHVKNQSNPHGVTKSQVGLGNVPNVATNDQTPAYTVASALSALVSGEKLSAAMGKLARAVTELTSHLANRSNPHGVTAAQVGAVPTSRTVNGRALSGDIRLLASDLSAVPIIRTVNGKSLIENITLSASDVSAVPTSRTVNGRALSGNITLSASDVGAAPSGYGLGGGARNIDSVLSITENGWYITNADTPTAGYWICHAFVTNNGSDVVVEAWNLNGTNKAKINKRSDTWGKWEWINPPMNPGTEYRTTERFGGKPVYQKVVNVGALPNATYKTVSHGVSDMQHLLYKDCTAGTHHFPANCAESGYIGVVDVYVDDTRIQITTSINWSAQTGYVKMKYTKTTD